MRKQKSAGIVLFRNISNENEFLLLNYHFGNHMVVIYAKSF